MLTLRLERKQQFLKDVYDLLKKLNKIIKLPSPTDDAEIELLAIRKYFAAQYMMYLFRCLDIIENDCIPCIALSSKDVIKEFKNADSVTTILESQFVMLCKVGQMPYDDKYILVFIPPELM